MWKLGLVLAAGLLLAGCGSNGDQPAAKATKSSSAKDVKVSVSLADSAPLSVLYNQSNGVCTTASIGDALDGVAQTPVQITVKDAEGKIVGSNTLPSAGGVFSKSSGCVWLVELTVPPTKFVEVTVTSRGPEKSVTSQVDADSEAKVLMDF